MTTQESNQEFNFAELIEWGYETGGDFDEALRIYTEHSAGVSKEIALLSGAEMSALEERFNREWK
jgi:hypothetical protein